MNICRALAIISLMAMVACDHRDVCDPEISLKAKEDQTIYQMYCCGNGQKRLRREKLNVIALRVDTQKPTAEDGLRQKRKVVSLDITDASSDEKWKSEYIETYVGQKNYLFGYEIVVLEICKREGKQLITFQVLPQEVKEQVAS